MAINRSRISHPHPNHPHYWVWVVSTARVTISAIVITVIITAVATVVAAVITTRVGAQGNGAEATGLSADRSVPTPICFDVSQAASCVLVHRPLFTPVAVYHIPIVAASVTSEIAPVSIAFLPRNHRVATIPALDSDHSSRC